MSVFSIICNSEKKYIYLLIIISIIHGFHGFIFTCIPFIFKEPILICTSKNDHSFSFSCDQNTACDNFIYEINHASSQMSLTTEFELICSKRFIRVTIQSLNFLGLTVAALTMVFVKINPYHRLKIMMICNGIASVSAIISSLLYNIWAIALALFSSYFFSYIWYVNVYLYSNETFRLPLRKIVPSILGSSFGVGTIFFSLFALFVENWRYHMAFYKGFPLLVLIGFLYLYNRKYDIQPINIVFNYFIFLI